MVVFYGPFVPMNPFLTSCILKCARFLFLFTGSIEMITENSNHNPLVFCQVTKTNYSVVTSPISYGSV